MSELIPQNYSQVVEAIKKHIEQTQYKSLYLVNKQMIQM